MPVIKGVDALRGLASPTAQLIADELVTQLNRWHSLPETWDNQLDTQIHRWYAAAKPVWPKRPYYSPSSANSCPRELYVKAKRAKRDQFAKPPYQGRWQSIGTAIGSVIQRDILAMERNLPDCPFSFEKNSDGTPVFEDFAKTNHRVDFDGQTFYLYGTCDGILRYVNAEGEVVRVGLEIKSKQTSAARTSLHSMREPEDKHVKQCVAYSAMYDVDYYVILYVNAAKKGWNMTAEDFEKTPDIRAFGIEIDDIDRHELFDRLARVNRCVENNDPPPLDIESWTFNNFKTACAESLSAEEIEDLRRQVDQVKRSRLPDWKKRPYLEALEFIEKVREGTAANGD
ncbi:hypothetical protein CHH52_13595 [Shouchella clausii]|nr:hypothetical protein CHH52_13595 [Shouchella clausii]